ncbi:Amidophosphoribosyltransferase precursor [Sedimentisphaera cyanobacteriorum]|uniref:Amidophosphoribosyltransferase n=1 Tax=Sedimentisphaera cyanobacteriorum TaxID=1940790 RepID=A0A1Q2HQY2_9BACT|nr:amidophosphoribosyltransferase [Sedimentisphaera cyanobacteriorum]AQQ09666.1 Amidophosphoribosyltransferase precursor [Sedimentisphaera cyanobacteriorum]
MSYKREECGVFGIWNTGNPAEKIYFGLHSLQHRGQESAGMTTTDRSSLKHFAGMGTVSKVFRKSSMNIIPKLSEETFGGIGHVRYSTAGASMRDNAQPMVAAYSQGEVAVAHNGNITNADILREEYESTGSIFKTTSDTEILIHMLAKPAHINKTDTIAHVMRHLDGAFCVLYLFPDRIEAARDPRGIRPLSIGKSQDGAWCVASESCAFDAIGGKLVRDVEPGEIVTLSDDGLSSRFFIEPGSVKPSHCIFEHVYFSRQNSRVFGENVHIARKNFGAQLAIEHPADADVVIPIPDSGTASAIGYANQSGIPFDMGFVRSHYIGRSFIAPTQEMRDLAVRLKLAVIKEAVEGKRVIVVDDSIVRGTTTRGKVRDLRAAGAKEVHIRVSCPPLKFPCFYGVDFASKEELVANRMDMDALCRYLEADSIGYLSVDGLLSCVNLPPENYCTACWTGNYKAPTHRARSKDAMGSSHKMLFQIEDVR